MGSRGKSYAKSVFMVSPFMHFTSLLSNRSCFLKERLKIPYWLSMTWKMKSNVLRLALEESYHIRHTSSFLPDPQPLQ